MKLLIIDSDRHLDEDAPLIKAHIRHLRQKIEPDPDHPSYILTVPGIGYSLVRHPFEEHEVENKRKIG